MRDAKKNDNRDRSNQQFGGTNPPSKMSSPKRREEYLHIVSDPTNPGRSQGANTEPTNSGIGSPHQPLESALNIKSGAAHDVAMDES